MSGEARFAEGHECSGDPSKPGNIGWIRSLMEYPPRVALAAEASHKRRCDSGWVWSFENGTQDNSH